jgi:DNA-directed RNA polymerase subunit omega
MARVTIEDCLLYIPNRFKIVELAAKRARELASGARTTVGGDTAVDHKVTVLALREIATGDYNESTQSPDQFDEFSLFEDDDVTDADSDTAPGDAASSSETTDANS